MINSVHRYLAAKTVYFGVGGGTKAFLNMVNENGEGLEASVIHVIKQGIAYTS